MAQITLNPSADTLIDSSSTSTNYGSEAYFAVGEYNTGSGIFRGLIKFDLSTIPVGSIITAANLILTVDSELSDNARTLSAYRVLRNWVETEATWNIFSTSNNWGTAGCANTSTDREATDIGNVSKPANPSPGDTITISLNATKVQEWFTGSVANYGLLLQNDTETNDAVYYRSRSHGTTNDRPKLTITYTPPGGVKIINFI